MKVLFHLSAILFFSATPVNSMFLLGDGDTKCGDSSLFESLKNKVARSFQAKSSYSLSDGGLLCISIVYDSNAVHDENNLYCSESSTALGFIERLLEMALDLDSGQNKNQYGDEENFPSTNEDIDSAIREDHEPEMTDEEKMMILKQLLGSVKEGGSKSTELEKLMEIFYEELSSGEDFQNEILVNMPGLKGVLKVALESGAGALVKKLKVESSLCDKKRKRTSFDVGVPFIKALPRNPHRLGKEMAGFINRLLEEHFFEEDHGFHVSMYL